MRFISLIVCLALTLIRVSEGLAKESRFDVYLFKPAVDEGDYLTVYGTHLKKAWSTNVGLSIDYSFFPPLKFAETQASGQDSIVDRLLMAHQYGSISPTKWWTIGYDLPLVLYNWYLSDEPEDDPSGAADGGAMLGDLALVTKIVVFEPEKNAFGLAIIPQVSFPTGDSRRYAGHGRVTGGGLLALEFLPTKKMEVALNIGIIAHDAVTRFGFQMDDFVKYGAAIQYKLPRRWDLILELFGTAVMNTSDKNGAPMEAALGLHRNFLKDKLSLKTGLTATLVNGVGSSGLRSFASLDWSLPLGSAPK